MAELDYANIIAAGQGLVPNLRQQMFQDQQLQMQREARKLQQRQMTLQLAEAERKRAREAVFRERLGGAAASGDPRAIAQLMLEFPEFAENLKHGATALSEEARRRNLTMGGSIYARANSGDYEGAAKLLEQRYNADLAAGHADPEDKEILDALRSGDPDKIKTAVATIGIHLAAVAGPEKFGDIYGKLNPTDKQTTVQREYDWRVGQFGKAAADDWLRVQDTKVVPLTPGGSIGVVEASGLKLPGPVSGYGGGTFDLDGRQVTPRDQDREGGDQSTQAAGFTMPVANGTFTSGFGASRDGGNRRHNGLDIAGPLGTPVTPIAPGKVVAVGSDGRSGSFVKVRHPDGTVSSYSHLGRQDVQVGQDVAAGTPLGTIGTSGNATGPVLHLTIRGKDGKPVDPRPLLGAGPASVRTVQEAMKLPKGTRYRTPDGREFVR